ncbi:ferric reductase [Pseudovirgaria hyperparasitica]|uniref:ferric-chelate reductase (NADPH) n=1 Tax=Pseudovirgaria hyperparasitica TaxID=470096 RepID=A0A6A6VQ48_9PEZI|nr:ferric reductase [Pseudovirgaria hyperparasitica]KAF2752768.1 ferric reductase [Pseudovirgaria hyperparasitica]
MVMRLALYAALALFIHHVVADGGQWQNDGPSLSDLINIDLSFWLGWFFIAFVASFIIYQISLHTVRYVRTVTCLNNEKQRYFAAPNAHFSAWKRHIIDAPLWKHRHHREFRLSAAVNIGTLPSRLQALLLVGYLAMNCAYCVIDIDFNQPLKAYGSIIRDRFGVLAVVNMIPLFLMAGRNNPLINLCGISFDTFNLMHRWLGRIVVLQSLGHTIAWMIVKVEQKGWAGVKEKLLTSETIISGTVATAAMVLIVLSSPSIVRHAFYEMFLHVHIVLAVVSIGALWYHLKDHAQMPQLYAVIALWAFERGVRIMSLSYRNIGAGGTHLDVETLPGDALRVNMTIARPWKFRPGQHVYLYVPSVGWWTSHPFSLAWSSEEDSDSSTLSYSTDEKNLKLANDTLVPRKVRMSLIIRRRTGFTDTLFRRAHASPTGRFSTSGIVEGPYGGQSLTSYGTLMLFAAGVGITHQLPYVRDTVSAFAAGTTATRRCTLVWVIQSPEHLEWIRPWMTSILTQEKRRDVLRILLFVTRPRSTREIYSPSESVKMFPGKPNVQALVDQEMGAGVGAACVSVCGTGGLADDVRAAVRARQRVWNVDLREESFSW